MWLFANQTKTLKLHGIEWAEAKKLLKEGWTIDEYEHGQVVDSFKTDFETWKVVKCKVSNGYIKLHKPGFFESIVNDIALNRSCKRRATA